MSVEATYSYYEKVSQELERIVHQVKEEVEQLTDGEKLFLVHHSVSVPSREASNSIFIQHRLKKHSNYTVVYSLLNLNDESSVDF